MLRSLLYLGFLVVAGVGWFMQRRNKTVHTNEPAQQPPVPDDPQAVIDMLRHPRWQSRLAAVRALGDEPSPETLQQLIPMLGDADSDVRDAVVETLTRCGAAEMGGILAVLRHGQLNARVAAAQVLQQIASQAEIPALVDALSTDVSAWVRIPAALALGNFATDEVVAALSKALADPNEDVANAARNALRQIGTPAALAVLSRKKPTGNSKGNDVWTSDLLNH